MRKLTQVWSGLLGCLVLAAGCNVGEAPKEPRQLTLNDMVVETTSLDSDVAEAVTDEATSKASKTKQPPKPLLTSDEIADGWIQLFDGETLFGWKPNSDVNWSVADGVITADKGTKPGLLLTSVPFADYELRCDFWMAKGGNSGVFLRTPAVPTDPGVDCYELNICDTHPQGFNTAKSLLNDGLARAEFLKKGEAPWTTATGLVPRGYVSKIDGSVQPYGLIVPESFTPVGPHRWRLDLWFHGRGEVLSEVNFLEDRRKNKGQCTPPDTIVLHPYGRYCNANKFAGEIDSFEALSAVQERYRVDPDRIAVRGL